jgi:hypothetical protein
VAIPNFPAAKRLLVEHLVLSHHGEYEYGSPKLPMTAEAVLLHYMDNLDAKMQTVRSELARAEAAGRGGDELTDWVRALERPLLNSQAYLAASARNSDGAPMVVESAATVVVHESVTESVTIEQTELTMNNGKVTDESREERNHALPFED